MPRRLLPSRRPPLPLLAAALAAVAILLGALVWFRPFLTRSQTVRSAIPAPAALGAPAPFTVAPGAEACMHSVTVEPDSRLAQFQIAPASAAARTGPSVELTLEGQGYRTSSTLPGGYRPGAVSLAVTPPRQPRLVTACFVNRGPSPLVLLGTVEARTISRSGTTVAGAPVVGDVALSFLEAHPSSLLDRLGTVFARASELTDHLLPVWLIWIIALICAFGVPLGMVGALYRALAEDEARAG